MHVQEETRGQFVLAGNRLARTGWRPFRLPALESGPEATRRWWV